MTIPAYTIMMITNPSAAAAGLDAKEFMAAVHSGAVTGADMANLLVDVDKRLKAVETGSRVRVQLSHTERTFT
jgi:hypothetical protein